MSLFNTDNELVESTHDYIRKHRLSELFEVNLKLS